MKTKFTKEYAEQMADAWTSRDDTGWSDYKEGYLKAIEETAAPELLLAIDLLLEAIVEVDPRELHYDNSALRKAYHKAHELVQKATQP